MVCNRLNAIAEHFMTMHYRRAREIIPFGQTVWIPNIPGWKRSPRFDGNKESQNVSIENSVSFCAVKLLWIHMVLH